MSLEGGSLPPLVTNLGEFKELLDHVITNYKISFELPPQEVSSFVEIINLFTDSLSSKHYERQILTLNRTLKCYQNGFLIKELPCVFQIANECIKRLQEVPKFMPILIEIVSICRLPFLLEKTSDELRYRTDALECIEQLGYLLRIECVHLREQIFKSINQFYNPLEYMEKVVHAENLKQTTEAFNRQIVDESDFCDSISKFYPLVGDEGMLKCVLHELMMSLSSTEVGCNKMLGCEIIPQLIRSLDEEVEKENSRMILVVSQVLWNLVQHGISALLSQQLADEKSLSILKDIFVKYLNKSFSKPDRQLRNDFLSIFCLMASKCAGVPLVKAGLVKIIAVLATFMEVRSQNVLVKHMKLNPCEKEDFELKLMLFDAIILLFKVPGSLEVFTECRLIQALSKYIHSGPIKESRSSSMHFESPQSSSNHISSTISHPKVFWFPKQYDELHPLALAVLSKVAPLMTKDAIGCDLPKLLLDMFNSCLQADEDQVDQLSNYKINNDLMLCNKYFLKTCVTIIHNLIATRNDDILKKFAELKFIDPFLELLDHLVSHCDYNLTVDRSFIDIQTDLMTIISILFEESDEEKETIGEKGAIVLVKYLAVDMDVVSPHIDRLNLLMSTIHCIWACIVGCETLENQFLEQKGICALLIILQKCPHNLKAMILGCLIDLVGKENAAFQFNSWQGKVDYENYLNSLVSLSDGTTMIKRESICLADKCPRMEPDHRGGFITAPQLLCQLWRDEEARMGVLRDENGIIIDLEAPLLSKEQQEKCLIVQPANHPSASVIEIFGNLRSKIYLIFHQIGFTNLPGICGRDHITLTIIENYLDLKSAEVVKEMIEEMVEEGIQPIAPDGESIQAMLNAIEAKHHRVQETQQEILSCLGRAAMSEEQIYYAKIQQTRKQEEWLKENFSDFLNQALPHRESLDSKYKKRKKAKRCGTADTNKRKPPTTNTHSKDSKCLGRMKEKMT